MHAHNRFGSLWQEPGPFHEAKGICGTSQQGEVVEYVTLNLLFLTMPALVSGFEYDIFISYRRNDNRSGWLGNGVCKPLIAKNWRPVR